MVRKRARRHVVPGVSSYSAATSMDPATGMEVGRMPYAWPEDTDFALWELDVLDRACPACGRTMYVCDHRYRRVHTLGGPVQLVCKLNHCPDPTCSGHARAKSPELDVTIALPKCAIGW